MLPFQSFNAQHERKSLDSWTSGYTCTCCLMSSSAMLRVPGVRLLRRFGRLDFGF